MQRPSPTETTPNPILCQLRERFGPSAWISLETFVEATLYTPEHGYYRQNRTRVGHAPGRDFYTAASLGSVFRRLVLAAIDQLAPEARREGWTWVELGAEPGQNLFAEASPPLPHHRTVGAGQPLVLDGPCVVFSNELFDAQPFRAFEVRDGVWLELGLTLDAPDHFEARPPIDLPPELPPPTHDGYRLDLPSGAQRLLQKIAAQPWHGLFLAFDYGLSWEVLSRQRPQGTARTYHQHEIGSDLLAAPGSQDITHHICWDHLQSILAATGFHDLTLTSQEAFFMHHATVALEAIISHNPGQLDPDRQTLKTLLHPENMGAKFQVLHARRSEGGVRPMGATTIR